MTGGVKMKENGKSGQNDEAKKKKKKMEMKKQIASTNCFMASLRLQAKRSRVRRRMNGRRAWGYRGKWNEKWVLFSTLFFPFSFISFVSHFSDAL